jgi:hypothetical protein
VRVRRHHRACRFYVKQLIVGGTCLVREGRLEESPEAAGEVNGRRAAIGQLQAIAELIAGTAGTRIDGRSPDVEFRA